MRLGVLATASMIAALLAAPGHAQGFYVSGTVGAAMQSDSDNTGATSADETSHPDAAAKDADTAKAAAGRIDKPGQSKKTGPGKNERAKPTADKPAEKGKESSRGAKGAGDASGGRDDELAQLARRIADLQETISALEAGTAGAGEEAPERDGKPSS